MTPAKPRATKGPEEPVTPSADRYVAAVEKDHALSMLMNMQQTLGEVVNELKHVAKELDGVCTKVDKLTHWQSRVLGGVAVVICLWAIFSVFRDDVHFGPPPSPAGQGAAPTALAAPAAKPPG
jgi:hypothetical protein